MAGLVDSIKNDVKKAGTNKSKFIYFREGQKQTTHTDYEYVHRHLRNTDNLFQTVPDKAH